MATAYRVTPAAKFSQALEHLFAAVYDAMQQQPGFCAKLAPRDASRIDPKTAEWVTHG
jgi:hypothetical protein